MKTLIVIWLVSAFIATGSCNAYFQHKYAMLNDGRHNCAQCTGWSLVFGPIALLLSPFVTGFYEHGFCWKFECEETD